jgi:hypothetical protein
VNLRPKVKIMENVKEDVQGANVDRGIIEKEVL